MITASYEYAHMKNYDGHDCIFAKMAEHGAGARPAREGNWPNLESVLPCTLKATHKDCPGCSEKWSFPRSGHCSEVYDACSKRR